jgi:hypothetical protein
MPPWICRFVIDQLVAAAERREWCDRRLLGPSGQVVARLAAAGAVMVLFDLHGSDMAAGLEGLARPHLEE